MNALLRQVGYIPRVSVVCRPRSNAVSAEGSQPEDYPVPVLEDEEALERAEKLNRSRNKSRLSKQHFNIINGKMPYDEPAIRNHLTVKYNRKMFGKYGAASGVYPSLCWPSSADIKDIKEYESVAFPQTIQEMMAQVKERRMEENRKMREREADIEAKLQKLDVWKKALNDKVTKKMEEVRAAKEKRERIVEEVRRHFGFKLDHRDERFQEMLAKREKEQKQRDKQAKKEAREKEMLAKFQMKASETKAAETKAAETKAAELKSAKTKAGKSKVAEIQAAESTSDETEAADTKADKRQDLIEKK